MGRQLWVRTMRAGGAAACAVAAFGALAQGLPTPSAAIERAQSMGVIAGLQRALSTPLEIVWLRTAAEIEAWASDSLAGATVGRTGWRYIFGGNAQFAPAPNEVARLLVSSLSLPRAPISAGKLDLSGRGRLFVISPEAPGRAAPSQVALVLAPGSTLQVSDTATPGVQIEIKAPERRPLLLGNLASANVRRMLALLVRPGAVSASSASVQDGKVALRTGGEIELAAIVDGRTRPSEPSVAVAAAPAPKVAEIVVAAAKVPLPEVPPVEAPAVLAAAVEEAPALVAVAPIAPIEATPAAPIEIAAIHPEPVATLEPAVAPPASVEVPPAPAVEVEPVPARPAPVAVAAIRAKPVIAIIESSPAVAGSPQQTASIERMRAEIEAEVARDRERLAHPHASGAPAKRFVLGV
jgi:hypothetical protein